MTSTIMLVADETTCQEIDLHQACASWCQAQEQRLGVHDAPDGGDFCAHRVSNEVVLVMDGRGELVTFTSITTPMQDWGADLSVDVAEELGLAFLSAVRIARGMPVSRVPAKSRLR